MRPFLTARWLNLLMLNFEVEPDLLSPYCPRGTEFDDYRGRHFVSIIGFQFFDTRVLGLPIPWHRNFLEVNLRFYVRRRDEGEIRRGVVFIREVVPLRAVAWVANRWYDENYAVAKMASRVDTTEAGGTLEYRWDDLIIRGEYDGPPALPSAGSLEEFITEHYWGYTKRRDGSTSAYEVRHPPWRVASARDFHFTGAAERCYGTALAPTLSRPPVSVFVADGSAVEVFPGARIVE